MDEMGYFCQTLPSALQPLAPGSRFAGPAFPVWGVTNPRVDWDRSVRQVLKCLGDIPREGVMVTETHGDPSSHIGELCVTWLKVRGARGAVIHGGVRDVEYILREQFPVFALHRTPADCTYRWELREWNVPIVVGGVNLAPGDFIVADHDGVICIPQALAAEVLRRGEEVVSTEDQVREAIRGGMLPLEAFDKFGRF
jgi:regulator of RNase E activity RraA